ncbi:hypothetical protein [Acidithiobacillus thiooxidans]|uniref:hypothetical protein n=1 Tax=Acidithiobacillus thiooxidans TaxID=930 RepID=UPI000B2A28F5|nr:hypothetical protein [Acidithiobacillus thiooxidans]
MFRAVHFLLVNLLDGHATTQSRLCGGFGVDASNLHPMMNAQAFLRFSAEGGLTPEKP